MSQKTDKRSSPRELGAILTPILSHGGHGPCVLDGDLAQEVRQRMKVSDTSASQMFADHPSEKAGLASIKGQ